MWWQSPLIILLIVIMCVIKTGLHAFWFLNASCFKDICNKTRSGWLREKRLEVSTLPFSLQRLIRPSVTQPRPQDPERQEGRVKRKVEMLGEREEKWKFLAPLIYKTRNRLELILGSMKHCSWIRFVPDSQTERNQRRRLVTTWQKLEPNLT